jgi:hypothetical protein
MYERIYGDSNWVALKRIVVIAQRRFHVAFEEGQGLSSKRKLIRVLFLNL